MKKILLVMVITTTSLAAFSQKLSADKVPAAVKEGLKKSHPHAVATWEREDANYEANFKENGKTMSCILNKQGTVLETETAIALSDLPATAKTYIDQHYKGKKVKETAKIVKANGEIAYEAEINGRDVMFDANGNFIEKKKEEKHKD